MFNKITIIGCGLIGSSILRVALKKSYLERSMFMTNLKRQFLI